MWSRPQNERFYYHDWLYVRVRLLSPSVDKMACRERVTALVRYDLTINVSTYSLQTTRSGFLITRYCSAYNWRRFQRDFFPMAVIAEDVSNVWL
jgi:hypothetical protein